MTDLHALSLRSQSIAPLISLATDTALHVDCHAQELRRAAVARRARSIGSALAALSYARAERRVNRIADRLPR